MQYNLSRQIIGQNIAKLLEMFIYISKIFHKQMNQTLRKSNYGGLTCKWEHQDFFYRNTAKDISFEIYSCVWFVVLTNM